MFVHSSGEIWNGDCLQLMRNIPDASIDMILCDLPYGTTQNKWDAVIPFEPLWREYWRVAKPNAAVVLTAAQPFTSALVMSSVNEFRYDWIWRKPKGVGHLNAKRMPMRNKEDICVFYREQPIYNPQMVDGKPYPADKNRKVNGRETYGAHGPIRTGSPDGLRYPLQIQDFPIPQQEGNSGLHPTQKPVALFEYLIKTYTNEGATILDNCSGSGTTAIAAHNTGRRSICIEKDPTYYLASCGRMWKAQQ